MNSTKLIEESVMAMLKEKKLDGYTVCETTNPNDFIISFLNEASESVVKLKISHQPDGAFQFFVNTSSSYINTETINEYLILCDAIANEIDCNVLNIAKLYIKYIGGTPLSREDVSDKKTRVSYE